jgi:hypothetical protein
MLSYYIDDNTTFARRPPLPSYIRAAARELDRRADHALKHGRAAFAEKASHRAQELREMVEAGR